MKLKKNERNILEKYFKIYDDYNDSDYELEDWTSGGVNMFISIDREGNKTVVEQLRDYIDNFDIDETIDLHRQAEDYRNAFTIKESVEDFESWLSYIEEITEELEKVEKQ